MPRPLPSSQLRPVPRRKTKKPAPATPDTPERIPTTAAAPVSDRKWNNQEVAAFLNQIGDVLAIQGENRFKIVAYRRAADVIAHASRSVQDLWAGDRDNLRAIPGVGEAIADKLDELFRTGRLGYYEKITAQVPAGLVELLGIPGVGPRTVTKFWKEFNITTLAALQEALQDPETRLKGVGEKTIENLKQGIATLSRHSTRVLLPVAVYFVEEMLAALKEACGDKAVKVSSAGSYRRLRATIGDVDLLAASKHPQFVLDKFTALPQVRAVIAKGDTKATVVAHNGMQVDLRVLEPARWGTALQYFTGSREHNIRLREIALRQGLSLSEWSLSRVPGAKTRPRSPREILCGEEAQVYATLGMDWIPPELREASGEIEAALKHRLPQLVELADLKGDLQCHSKWSDGKATIAEMAEGARRLGLKYIAITDHSRGLGVANGLDDRRTREQWAEIDALNRKYGSSFRVLKSVEVEIKADGSLDAPDDLLAGYDVVVATTHSSLNQPRDKITARVVKALRNPYVDIFGHPTGRLIGSRESSALDLEEVFRVARETGTILEIDGTPERMDLEDVHARRAVELGLKLVIDSDAHHPDGFQDLRWGIAMARRGWVTAADVLNTLEWDELKQHLKRYRKG